MSSYSLHVGRLVVLFLLLKTSHGKVEIGNQETKASKSSLFGRKSKSSAEFKVYLKAHRNWKDVSTVCTSNGGRKWKSELVHKGLQQGWSLPETKKLECDVCWLNENNQKFTYGHFMLYSADSVPSQYRAGSEGSKYCQWIVKNDRLYLKNFKTEKYEKKYERAKWDHDYLEIPFEDLYRIYKGHYQTTAACGKLLPNLKKKRSL